MRYPYSVSRCILPCDNFINVHAADLLKARVNVQQEKRNAIVHLSKSAIGRFAAPEESDLNAHIGVTNDFDSAIPGYILFKHTMSLDEGTKYAEHQGKNQGSAQCELVQKGSSLNMPAVPVAVLAQNCTIIFVKC